MHGSVGRPHSRYLALDQFAMDLPVECGSLSHIVEDNDRPLDLQLASLRFYDSRAGHPTNAGVLMFGKDACSLFPGAYVQYVQYAGDSEADDVLQERRIGGDLLDVLRDLNRLAGELAEERPVGETRPFRGGGFRLPA